MVEEFAVTHLSHVAYCNAAQPDTFIPRERKGDDAGYYMGERELFGIILQHARERITGRDLAAAFFDTTGRFRETIVARLDRAVRVALPSFKETGLMGMSKAFDAVLATHAYKPQVEAWKREAYDTLGVVIPAA